MWLEKMLQDRLGNEYEVLPVLYKMDRILIGVRRSPTQFVQVSYQCEPIEQSTILERIADTLKETLDEFQEEGYVHELVEALKMELPDCMEVDRVEIVRGNGGYIYERKW